MGKAGLPRWVQLSSRTKTPCGLINGDAHADACAAPEPEGARARILSYTSLSTGTAFGLTEVVQVDPIRLPGAVGSGSGHDRNSKGDRANRKRDVGRSGRRHRREQRRKQSGDCSADVLRNGHRRNPCARRKQLGEKTWKHSVIALVDNPPHEQRHEDRQRHIGDADGV